jgi:hypothetical protein
MCEYSDIIRRSSLMSASRAVDLGDLGLGEIAAITKQKEDNIRTVAAEHARWRRACDVIVPLLEKNPGWLWRDACDYLRDHGGFPDLS